MEFGIVKWFSAAKGYGFITPERGGNDEFVHKHDLLPPLTELKEGQRVQFELGIENRRRRSKAVAVSLAAPERRQ